MAEHLHIHVVRYEDLLLKKDVRSYRNGMRVNKTIKIRWREKIIKEGIKKENNLDRQIGEQMNMHVLLTYLKIQ